MWSKFLLLIFVASFLFRTDLSFNQDLGRHLKLGEIILKTGQIPKTNLFSYTNPDYPFINTHWLFEVLAYIFSQYLGLHILLILKIAAILTAVWLMLKVIPKDSTALLLPIAFIFLHVLRERLELRPEIFSFLFTGLTLFILERFLKKGTRWIFLIPLIQLVWINTHIYFFIGLMIQAVFIIHTLGVKLTHPQGVPGRHLGILGIVLLLSILVSLINPNGLAGVLYPLNVTKNYGYTIVENQNLFFLESINFRDPNFLFVKLSAGIAILSFAFTFLRHNFDLKNILLSLSGLVLALMHVRSFPYLVFLSLPATMQNFGLVSWNNLTKLLTIATIALLIFESYFYLNGDYYKYKDDQHIVGLKMAESVKGAMDFVIQNDLPGPIYNNFDIGSYILYRGYPKYRVFVDGRPEAYPATFFQQVYIPTQSDYAKFKGLESQYGFKTIIFSHTDQTPWGRNFLQNVVKDEAWKLIYIDDFMLVLVKKEVVDKKNLAIIDLSKLNPITFRFDGHVPYLRMGLFLLSTGYTDSGKQFILRTLEVFPNSPIANLIVGQPTQNKFFW